MLGAIAGDIAGSVYEWQPIKIKDFPLFQEKSRFTDDSVLTVAILDAVRNGRAYPEALRDWGNRYPKSGYGGRFRRWLRDPGMGPYKSWGNGSAMRVSPVGFLFADMDSVLGEARKSAACTHDHPEGIRGAQAAAFSVFLARQGKSPEEIAAANELRFGYDLSRSLDEIRPGYSFDVSCQGTLPPAIQSVREAADFEDALRNAISLGGDADTLACISGGIAEALFGSVPEWIIQEVGSRLPEDMLALLREVYPGIGL